MVKVNCESKDSLKLVEMAFFQGNLKKRTQQDIDSLKESIVNEGLMMPFAVWTHEDKNYLLDGHGRKQALMQLCDQDPDILEQQWPVIYISAETEDDARKALLQITSQYGKVTKQGVKQFCVSIPDYKAPVINKFIPKPVSDKPVKQAKTSDKVILKIRVTREKLEQVREVFKQFDFIEVL